MATNPCNIEDFGAKGDNSTINTHHIQKAINSCHQIYVPSGIFKTGKLRLTANLTIEIAPDGVLLGAPHLILRGPMIHASSRSNLTFIGGGRIDSGGTKSDVYKVIELKDCNNIKFHNFLIYQHAHDWCFLCENCTNVEMNQFQLHGFDGRDGLDLVGCKNVVIHHSLLLGSDDALALKSNTTIDSSRGESYNSYNISVYDCEIASKDDNALQFGSETPGNFTNISFRNIKISSAGKAAIGITSNDGAYISNVFYENIQMENVATPFWIKLTNRTLPIGRIYDIYITNVTASRVYGFESKRNFTSTLDGFDKDNRLGPNIVFKDVTIEYVGGGALCAVDIVPPDPDIDYRPRYLGPRPSYGFFIRHADDITLDRVSVSFKTNDFRPAFFLNDTSNVIMSSVTADTSNEALSTCNIVLQETNGFILKDSNTLSSCEFIDYPSCPHEVYYYSPYDY